MIGRLLGVLFCAVSVSIFAQSVPGDRAMETVIVEIDGVPPGATPSSRLSVRALDGADRELSTFPIDAGGATSVELPAGRWLVEPVVEGYWSHERTVEITAGTRNAVRLGVWPAARVEGTFTTPKGVDPPSTLSLQLSHAEGAPTTVADDVAADCEFTPVGSWSCTVPQGSFDVVIRPRGFVPVYRWGTVFDGKRPLELGTIAIKPGSSLSGFVSDPKVERLELRLRPLVLGSAGAAEKEKLSKPVAIVRPTPRGFFHFTDITPGFWVIDAWAPGYAVTTNGPFEVHEGAETSLRDRLTLLRPGSLDLTVSPPADLVGQPWRVSLRLMQQAGAATFESAIDETADAAGRIATSNLQPGKYRVSVADSRGNRLAQAVQVIESGHTTFAVVAIDYVRIKGQITLGGEPLAARLEFGGRFGVLTTEMRSDEEGSFEGALPKDGEWPIAIEAADGSLSTSVTRSIAAGEDREANVAIALPATKADGVVVDHSGNLVEGAQVILRTKTERLTVRSAKDGSFSFRCFPIGRVFIYAEHTRGGIKRSSPPEDFVADDNAEREGIRLALGLTREITGRISSEGRPVVGATIVFVPGQGSRVTARSDIDGTYRVEVADQAVGSTVYVSPPGYAFAARAVPRLGPTFDVQVQRQMGSLQVAFPEIPPSDDRPALYLRHDGVKVEFVSVGEWARGHGADFFKDGLVTIPAVEPGTWEACKREGSMEECDRGTLANGGSTLLKMPALMPN
ncbi:MAG: carboxypeptidase-like regulatory domain-containing protein [Thermoanaerobaculia bacterium]|nr:carboxypeptidase-like regulatory domain-containing protein [Thermoanaerobaculia bacterium]